ncbi:hypothetical protein [Chryseobacterium indologenes]|uniref:Magnesium citrate secondary transporter n=1 Tax=Chryseobacterium indologenes TaxID=253 RepID=A0A0N0ZTM0_CHRID|nr:hypothetical protein [Chryseobacterium indologenes]KPE49357.1 hypothetical protein AOB46_20460 [Chryseobacterium indologenes]
MKDRVSYWFLSGLTGWFLVIFLRHEGIFIPVISNYFTDFITVPMYAYLIEYLMNKGMGYSWKPDLNFIMTSVLYLSLLFEALCPLVSERFTGDLLDVLAYLTGGILYYFLKIRPIGKKDTA